MLKSFNKHGRLKVLSYTFKKTRIQSPTECYTLELVDYEGYTCVSGTSLATSESDQVYALVEIRKRIGYEKPYRILHEDGRVLWNY